MNTFEQKVIEVKNFIDDNSLPNEHWKQFIKTKPKKYHQHVWFVSTLGRICRDFTITYGCLKSDGYMRLGDMTGVHKLVAEAFIPKTDEDIRLNRTFVDHINGNKSDNRITNLRWCTNKENSNFDNVKRTHLCKDKNPMCNKKPANFNKVLCNNGIESHYFNIDSIPKGYILGRIK